MVAWVALVVFFLRQHVFLVPLLGYFWVPNWIAGISTNHTSSFDLEMYSKSNPSEGWEGTWCLMTTGNSSVRRVANKRIKPKQPPCCLHFLAEKLKSHAVEINFCKLSPPHLTTWIFPNDLQLGNWKKTRPGPQTADYLVESEACQVQLMVPGCSYCGAYFGWQHLKAQRKRLGHSIFFVYVSMVYNICFIRVHHQRRRVTKLSKRGANLPNDLYFRSLNSTSGWNSPVT